MMSGFWKDINKLSEEVPKDLSILRTRRMDAAEFERFKEFGLDFKAVHQNDSRYLLSQTERKRHSVAEDRKHISRKILFADWAIEMYANSIRSSSFLSVCPFTGLIKSSQCSIPFGDNFTRKNLRMCAYRFESTHVYYIITGQLWGERIGLYIPAKECFIQLANRNINEEKFLVLLNKWKKFLRNNSELVRRYISDPAKECAVVLSYPTNLYHYLCNGLSGLDKLDQHNVLGYIKKLYVNSYEFFGSVGTFFPALNSSVHRSATMDFDKEILQENLFALAPAHISLRPDFIASINNLLLREIEDPRLAEISKFSEESHLKVLVYIKINRRAWLDQEEGLARIIEELSKKYDRISVICTGFSFPSNIHEDEYEELKSKFQELIDSEKRVLSGVQERINSENEVEIIDLIGERLNTVIAYAEIGDFYISPGGVGMVPFTLFANKPGVFHSNNEVSRIPLKNRPYCFERDDIRMPSFLSNEEVQDVQLDSSTDSSHADSYHCDWRSIYRIITEDLGY